MIRYIFVLSIGPCNIQVGAYEWNERRGIQYEFQLILPTFEIG